jgi:hypothetical protein
MRKRRRKANATMAIPIAPVQSRWRRSSLAETGASDLASAACYRFLENIRAHPIVVSELKLRDVERQVFRADLVERAYHAALEDRPETLNRVRVHRADHVFVVSVSDDLVLIAIDLPQAVVADPLIGHEQAHFLRNRFGHEFGKFVAGHALENARDHVALAGDGTDNRNLARTKAATSHLATSLAVVLVLGLAAYERLVNLYDAAKLLLRRDQRRTNLVAHGMGRLVAAEAHHALNLKGTHSLLARQHEVGDAKPVAERLLGVLENRSGEAREPIAVLRALAALPVKRLVAGGVVEVRIAAARAMNAKRPAAGDQIAKASLIVANRETILELGRRHLRDWFRSPCHSISPWGSSVGAYCHA